MTTRQALPRLSDCCRDPRLAAVFAKAERDTGSAALVEPRRPEPSLKGGEAVTPARELEMA